MAKTYSIPTHPQFDIMVAYVKFCRGVHRMDVSYPMAQITQLKVPVPLPVHFTNCYVIDTKAGYVVVDAGMDTVEARNTWVEFIDKTALPRSAVQFIFITHFHPDHLGLAQWLSDRLDAPVAMMAGEAEFSMDYGRQRTADHIAQIESFYVHHGVPQVIVTHWIALDQAFSEAITVPHKFDMLADRQTRLIGSEKLLFIEQGGHTPHQGLLYLPDRNVLFTGDQVLSRITPNISLWPLGEPNPLGDYIASLDQLSRLPHPMGLPAHEAVIPNVNQRITELMVHHDLRSNKLIDCLTAGPLPAYELTKLLFTRPLDDYQLRFAIGETLAHLEWLKYQGRVKVDHQPPLWLYARV